MGSRRSLTLAAILVIVLLAGGATMYYLRSSKQKFSDSFSSGKSASQAAEQRPKDTGTPPATVTKQLQIYYIATAIETTDPSTSVGCGDNFVPVKTEAITTTDPLKEAMIRLLGNHSQFYGESGLYNALYQSDLAYKDGRAEGSTVTVNLTGNIRQNGECDAPRIKAQLEQTAKDASGATVANITVNGQSLDSILSLK